MRIPSGKFEWLAPGFLSGRTVGLFGCLSFEERCTRVPLLAHAVGCSWIELLKVDDDPDGSPCFALDIEPKVAANWNSIAGPNASYSELELLSTLDQMDDKLVRLRSVRSHVEVLILDVTAFPKRFFCHFVKRLIKSDYWQNVIATYTTAGPQGYTQEHLAYDPDIPQELPGFAAPAGSQVDIIVGSFGFEALGIKSLISMLRESSCRAETKMHIILPYPPNGEMTRRQWLTIRNITNPDEDIKSRVNIVSAWDAHLIYRHLTRWYSQGRLLCIPCGPKAHSLSMAIFATQHPDCGIYYTQPKSYNPNYSRGYGDTWGYVVKWDGVACYNRPD